jgi:pimeloyl-ACP methyl ester carboxylesterase
MKKKILLLHGWNWKNYTSLTESKDVWNNRKEFVDKLSEKYDVYKLTFPGFCGEPEPERAWELSDFANYVKEYLDKNNIKPDYILGYSFGGAVAIEYNLLFDNSQKLLLVSPAITRNKEKSKHIIQTPKFMQPLRNRLRDFYLVHIIKNNYMINGTKFLNETYQNIVRVELLDELEKIDPKNIKIIYGSIDKQVNPSYVINNINPKFKDSIKVIEGGTHDIANTNADDIISIISK